MARSDRYLSAETDVNVLRSLTLDALKTAIKEVVSEHLLYEFGELYLPTSKQAELKQLIKPYETFEELKTSEHYEAFQKLIKGFQNEDFKRLIQMRLLYEDPEVKLQTLLQTKIEQLKTTDSAHGELSKEAQQTVKDKFGSAFNQKRDEETDTSEDSDTTKHEL